MNEENFSSFIKGLNEGVFFLQEKPTIILPSFTEELEEKIFYSLEELEDKRVYCIE